MAVAFFPARLAPAMSAGLTDRRAPGEELAAGPEYRGAAHE
jgi:hypothetical protein